MKKSDLLTQAKNRLSTHPYAELRRLECTVEGNDVVLSGVVSSFFHKQLAQEAVRINGNGVKNTVKVRAKLE